MKILACLLSLSLVSAAFAQDDPAEPAELERLRQQWEQSVAQEMEKKNKIYLKALEKLQKKFTGANNLAAAVAVNEEMQKVKAMKPQENLFNPPNGEWKALYNSGNTRIYSIKGNKITVVKSSFGGAGKTVELKPHLQGWLAEFDNRMAEYIFLIDDKICIHHWKVGMDHKTMVPSHIAMATKE